MNKYWFSNNNYEKKHNNFNQSTVNGTFNENEVADKFKDHIISFFNINNETVTKLEKSKVKQIYSNKFQQESQGNNNNRIYINIYFQNKI